MDDDAALLHAYAEEGSENAFTALVRRHVDLVYATALRRVNGDSHLAADIAQQVFATLAQQVNRSWRPRVLSAWLHTATRNAAANTMTSEKRRRVREQAALDSALATAEATPEWAQLRPVLDAAIDELPELDRAAVVLRFLERKAFGEIGEALSVSADAARMRTERALDKLRDTLAKRGITSTAAAVGAIISSQPLVSAPAGLVSSIVAMSLVAAGAGAGTLAVGVASILMNLKTVMVGVAVLTAFGAGIYVGLMQQFDAPTLPAPETPRHSQTIADLRKENLSLRTEVAQLKSANAKLAIPSPAASTPAPRVVSAPATQPDTRSVSDRQKATLNNLRQIAAARDRFLLENGRFPTLGDLVGETKYIPQLVPVNGEDYTKVPLIPLAQPLTVMTPDGPVAFDPRDNHPTPAPPRPRPPPHIVEMKQRLDAPMQAAWEAYKAANNGKRPPDTEAGARALIPYFSTPQTGADFVEYVEALKQAGLLPP